MKKIPMSMIVMALALGIMGFVGSFAGGLYFSGAMGDLPTPKIFHHKKHLASSLVPQVNQERLERLAKELDKWSQELTVKKLQLLDMDKSLLQRENILKAEREALDQERRNLSALQDQLKTRFIVIEKGEGENLEQMASLYDTMKPEEASRLARGLSDDQVTKLLVTMKAAKSARLLESWSDQFPDDRDRITRVLDGIRIVAKDMEPLTPASSIAPASPASTPPAETTPSGEDAPSSAK